MARKTTVQVQNLNKVTKTLKKYGVEARDLKGAMQRIGAHVTNDAISGAPVKTGALQRTVKQSKRQNSVYIYAGSKKAYYAPFVHYGTSQLSKNPWMTRAANKNAPFALRELEAEMNRLITKLGLSR
jgi:HK97 gp10 family phage protein